MADWNKIGRGIAGGLQGAMKGAEWGQNLAEQRDRLRMQKEQLAAQKEAMQAEKVNVAFKQSNDLLMQAADLAVYDPDSFAPFLKSKAAAINQFMPIVDPTKSGWINSALLSNDPKDLEPMRKNMADFKSLVSDAADASWAAGQVFKPSLEQQQVIRRYEAVVGAPFSGMVAKSVAARNTQILKASAEELSVRGATLDVAGTEFKQGQEKKTASAVAQTFPGQTPASVATKTAAGLEPVAGSQPGTVKQVPPLQRPVPQTQFEKTQDTEQAKALVKDIENIPKAQQSIASIDRALSLVDKVWTGPVAGKDFAFFMQRLSSDDAQSLHQALAEQSVRTMMEFAKNAGVRAVDTPTEQQNLFDSIANKTLSRKTLRDTLVRMKSQQEEAITNTQSKQDYINQKGNLRGWMPTDKSKPAAEQPVTEADIDKMDKKQLEHYLKTGKRLVK